MPSPSLLLSSSLPPSSLLPPPSRKRPRSPSSPPPPPPAVLPPPLECVESVGDDVETLCASLASAEQETVTLCARVDSLEQHNMTRDGDRTQRAVITEQDIETLRARAEAAEHTWKIFRENTLDFGSILEETGQECNFTQRRLEELLTEGGDGVRITC
ncbi:hypothetical protein Tco_1441808, partial [Tanacetum coccineum]